MNALSPGEILIKENLFMTKPLTAVLLAAGEGKRMHSDTSKMLHSICGRSLIGWAYHAVKDIVQEPPVAVVGHKAEDVKAHMGDSLRYALQAEQRGTGHALLCAKAYFENRTGKLLVIAGDMPLLRAETLAALADAPGAAALLTAKLDDPTGYGRVVRDETGNIMGIVEHRDATPEQRAIHEVNLSAYCFDIEALMGCLDKLTCSNDQGEYYITDCISLLYEAGHTMSTFTVPAWEGMGVNDRLQLSQCENLMRKRINEAHMLAGVTMLDPERTYIEANVTIGRDCLLYPDVVLEGNTVIGEKTTLCPGCRIIDSKVGSGCTFQAVVARDAIVGDNVTIGPFVQLRPGSNIAKGCKIGDFVEIKNSNVGEGTKLPHLSYIGDGDVGCRVNVGCGSVFVNYDGAKKHRTVVGDDVFIGCNTSLVAPVTVGDRAFTAAGSVVTKDIPADGFAIARQQQTTKEGYAAVIRARKKQQK